MAPIFRILRKFNTVSSQIYKPKLVDLPQKYKSPYTPLLAKYGLRDPNHRINAVFKIIGNALGVKIRRPKTDHIDEKKEHTDPKEIRYHFQQEAIKNTKLYTGDGSYTTSILAAAMSSLVIKAMEEGSDPKMLNKGIKYGIEMSIKYLNEISIPIVTPNEMDEMAKSVTNGDIPLAEAITDAFVEVGRDGWIEVEESNKDVDFLEKIKGIKINSGYTSPEFINDGDRVLYHEIYLLISEDILSTKKCVLPSITAATKERYPLLILAKDFEGEALQTLIDCRIKDKMRICAVKTPPLDRFGKRLLFDLAISCDATIFSDQSLRMLEEIRPKQHFGLAWSANITKDRTIITTKPLARKNNSRIRRNIKDLKAKIMMEDSQEDKNMYRERLARFFQRMAVVKVGGKSKDEIKERCVVARKTIMALRAALEDGVVPGGGSALAKSLKTHLSGRVGDDFTKGLDIVNRALWIPCMVIAKNAGLNPIELATNLSDLNAEEGFDICTKRLVNMRNEGILDPTKIVTSSLRFASDIAKNIAFDYVKISEAKHE